MNLGFRTLDFHIQNIDINIPRPTCEIHADCTYKNSLLGYVECTSRATLPWLFGYSLTDASPISSSSSTSSSSSSSSSSSQAAKQPSSQAAKQQQQQQQQQQQEQQEQQQQQQRRQRLLQQKAAAAAARGGLPEGRQTATVATAFSRCGRPCWFKPLTRATNPIWSLIHLA